MNRILSLICFRLLKLFAKMTFSYKKKNIKVSLIKKKMNEKNFLNEIITLHFKIILISQSIKKYQINFCEGERGNYEKGRIACKILPAKILFFSSRHFYLPKNKNYHVKNNFVHCILNFRKLHLKLRTRLLLTIHI